MDPAAPLSSDMKGLKVCILADGIPLRAMGHTGPPERRIAYVEINEPHAIAIRLTLSRGFRPYKHRITVDYSWDGNEPFETPIIKKSQYSTHAYTDTIDTVTVKENGIETEHRFRIKPLSICKF